MKPVLLVYKTKTGFTKKYAEWIGEEIPCNVISLEKMKTADIKSYDVIIYGAGIQAGQIRGLKKFRRLVGAYHKKIVVFATGGAPYSDEIVAKIRENNLLEEALPFFYFEGGINYERMGFTDRTVMKIYSKILESKTSKSESEKGASTALLSSYDHSNKEHIKSMVLYFKGLLK